MNNKENQTEGDKWNRKELEEYTVAARMICGAFDIPAEVRLADGGAVCRFPADLAHFSEIFANALQKPLAEPLTEFITLPMEGLKTQGLKRRAAESLSANMNTGMYLYHDLLGVVRIPLPNTGGWLMVGPSFIHRPTPLERSCLISDIMEAAEQTNQSLTRLRKEVTEYVNSFPVYTVYKLIQLVQFCHWSIHRELIGWDEIFAGGSMERYQETATRQAREASKRRELAKPHNSYLRELEEQEAVRTGNVEWIKKLIKQPMVGTPGTLSEVPLRNEQNLFISAITLWTRKAVEGGLTQEEAYTMSDAYIYQSEHSTKIQDIQLLRSQAAVDFTQKVAKHKKAGHSPMVEKSMDYIYNHLHESIRLIQIAESIPISLSYLCRIFKSETGMTLAEYMQKQRIEEAKNRLRFTQDSYVEIAADLNYKSQSYFIAVFRKQEGMTPAEYRKKMAAYKKTE